MYGGYVIFQNDRLANIPYKCDYAPPSGLAKQKSFQTMLFSSWVVLTALISLSTFATGTSDRADALPDGAHLLEPYLTSALQSSSTQHDGGSSPKVIRGLLFKRQSCPIGFGLCTSGNGLCCPLGGRCCNSGESLLNFLINAIV